MSYDMTGPNNQGIIGAPPMLPPSGAQQSGVLFCNKHDSVINTFCMMHQVPLCQTCVHEHLHLYNPQMPNAPYGQPSLGQCELLAIERAIAESLQRMQHSITSAQDFIEFKKNLVDFPDEATLQMYLQQN